MRKRNVRTEKSKSAKEISFNESENAQSSPGLLTTCFLASLYTVGVLVIVAAIGYYKAPFTALPLTDLSQEVKLEGIFQRNERLTKGTK